MRKVFLLDHDFPPTEEDITAATDAGAAEVICGIPEALAALGIDSFGYHEIADPTPPVPQVVSMRQAQLALFGAGRLDAVEAAVAAADKATQIWWATSRDVERQNAVLKAVQAGLGWPDAEVDALFVAAAALP
jgi:hypothetical protein